MDIVLIDAIWKKPNNTVHDQEYMDGIFENAEIVSKVDYIENQYVAYEYTKINNNYGTIGISTNKELKSLYAIGKFGYKRELKEVCKGLWISFPHYSWSEELKSYQAISYPIGINQCGTIKFEGEDINGNRFETQELKIKPSLITEEEYEIMESQLKIITENLVDNYQKGCNGESSANSLINLDILNNHMQDIYEILEEINNRPEECLIEVKDTVKIDKIKKFTPKLFIEQEMYPFKNTFNTTISQKTFDIKEHRILKGAIKELLETCQNQKIYEEGIISSIRFQIQDIQEIKTNDRNIIQKANYKIKILKDKGIYIKNRIDIWDNIHIKLESALDLGIFVTTNSTDKWEETHIFKFNPLYEQAFEKFEVVNKLLRKNEILSIFQSDLIKSPDLYEKWVFFKVLDYFVNDLNFNNSEINVIDNMINYYNKHSTLRGFSIEIKNCNNNNKIIITSEKNLEGQMPDISLVFMDENKSREVFLDAKYKRYSRNGSVLFNDLNRSAIRYMQLSQRSPGAFLVHPDEDLEDNFAKLKPHKCGYFKLRPSNDKGIRILGKLVMHFYMGWDDLCPECGKEGSTLESNSYKAHYECKDSKCGTFWVQNSCRYRREHPKCITNLYKYIDSNYHKESEFEWDVHCPVCGKSYRGNIR
ncbi:MAG: hypothetical protein RSD36_13485 [Terrisporobacter sp.]